MVEPHRTEPFADLISLVAGPIAAVIRSFDQLRKGSEELMRGLENFNSTMETLDDTAQRINRLLGEFEEPIRALMPQVTRTLQTADAITSKLSGPVDDVAPGLARLAETLNSPVFTALPTDLGAFLEAMNDLVRRLGPLSQLADSASGLFGLKIPGMPSFPGMGRPSSPPPASPPPSARPSDPEPVPARRPAPARSDAHQGATMAAKKPAKKSPAKKSAAKKSAAKKSAAKKAAPKKLAAETSVG